MTPETNPQQAVSELIELPESVWTHERSTTYPLMKGTQLYTADQMKAYAAENAAYWQGRWKDEHKRADGLMAALAAIRFDVYELALPELRAAFGGQAKIAVVHPATVQAIKDLRTPTPPAADGE